MIREMLGIAEGILQDLHNDHSEVASLMDRIIESEDGAGRAALFDEMKTKLLAHAHAEQEVLYRPLEASQSEASRSFASRAPTSIRSSNSSFRNYRRTATKRANSGRRSSRC